MLGLLTQESCEEVSKPIPVFWRDLIWMAVLRGIVGFFYGFLIGANDDVASAFVSFDSSEFVALKHAVLIAGICESSSVFFLGASVNRTVRNKIVDVDLY
jgi:phosphate/sulfate permease